jgi:hypothetical protein
MQRAFLSAAFPSPRTQQIEGDLKYRVMRTHPQRNSRKALLLQRSLHVAWEMQAARTSGLGWQANGPGSALGGSSQHLLENVAHCGKLRLCCCLWERRWLGQSTCDVHM